MTTVRAGETQALRQHHQHMLANGHRLRTILCRTQPDRDGTTLVKMTWCRRKNPAVVVKRSERLHPAGLEALLDAVFGFDRTP